MENEMSDEVEPREIPAPSGGLSIGSIQADTVKAAGGNIEEDNSVGKIDQTGAEFHDKQSNVMNVNTDKSEKTPEGSIVDVLDVLIALGGPVTRSDIQGSEPSPEAAAVIEEVTTVEDFEPVTFDDDPSELKDQFQTFAAMPPEQFAEVPEEEKTSFASKLTASLGKAATVAGPALLKCCAIGATMCSAASPAGPIGLAGIALAGIADKFGKQES